MLMYILIYRSIYTLMYRYINAVSSRIPLSRACHLKWLVCTQMRHLLALGQSDAASVALLRTKLTPDWLCNRSAAIPKTKSIPIADLTLVSIKSIQF